MALNIVNLMGNLTADPELRQTPDGTPVLTFRIAVPKPFKKDAEDGKSNANFITCVAWRQNAENIAKFFRKGQRIIIQGAISTGSHVDKDGNTRYDFEVVVDRFEFVERKENPATGAPVAQAAPVAPTAAPAYAPQTSAAPAYAAPAAAGNDFPW